MAVITNESTATTRLAWLTSNASISQLITTSHGSHAAYQPHSQLVQKQQPHFILQTAKIGSNALQKINVIPQLKQTNKQGIKKLFYIVKIANFRF